MKVTTVNPLETARAPVPRPRIWPRIWMGVWLALLLVALIHLVEAFTWSRVVHTRELTFRSSAVPKALDGYVIALIADLHYIDLDQLNGVAASVTHRKADLFAIVGDFPNDAARTRKCAEILATAQTTDGSFVVQGNHDYDNDLFAICEKNGITPLAENGVALDRVPLYVCGVTDYWYGLTDAATATKEKPDGSFCLMLSHNPDVSVEQDCSEVDLMLSGHTHGGQATMFGLWKPFLGKVTKYPSLFGGGFARTERGTDVFTTKGVGQYRSLPRIFAPPELVFLTLRSA